MNGLTRFSNEYARQLAHAVTTHPNDYGYAIDDVMDVAARMSAAFARGSYNKDGRAIKATCKALGIKYTYAAINAYVAQGEVLP